MTSSKKIILITGCSSGFGYLLTLKLAKQHTVIATMRDVGKQSSLRNACEQHKLSVDIQQCDVTDNVSILRLVDYVTKTYDGCDVLVNNAGIAPAAFFEDTSDREFRETIETNVFGVQAMTRSFLPLLKQRKGFKIINISSISGRSAKPLLSAYCASKWALEGFSECLRYELLRSNGYVVCIEPGSYQTPIFEKGLTKLIQKSETSSEHAQFYKKLIATYQKKLKGHYKKPDKVIQAITKVIEKRKPQFRVLVGKKAKFEFVCRKILPFWVIEKIIALVLKKMG